MILKRSHCITELLLFELLDEADMIDTPTDPGDDPPPPPPPGPADTGTVGRVMIGGAISVSSAYNIDRDPIVSMPLFVVEYALGDVL